jgi:hypothetical protein
MNHIHALTALANAGKEMTMAAGFGYAYGHVFKIDPILCTKIFAVRSLAFNILCKFPLSFEKDQAKHLIMTAVVATAFETASIFTLRHYGIIGVVGTIWYAFTAAWGMSGLLTQAQNLALIEKQNSARLRQILASRQRTFD